MNFNTYASWKEGSKAFGAVKFVGNKNGAEAFDENMRSIGSWMDDVGYGFPIKKRRATKAIVRKPQAESEYVYTGHKGLDFEPVTKLTSKSKTGFKTVQNPAIIKPMKLKPGQRSRQYVAPVRLTQEEMKKRSAAHIEKMRAYRASRGWKEKVPNEQGRYTFGKRRPKSDSGEYRSFGAWTSAVRRAGGVPQSELSEPQGAHNRNTGQIIGVWDGSSGSVYRNNPVRQRIAVSLSRSQVRRNPFNDRNLDA